MPVNAVLHQIIGEFFGRPDDSPIYAYLEYNGLTSIRSLLDVIKYESPTNFPEYEVTTGTGDAAVTNQMTLRRGDIGVLDVIARFANSPTGPRTLEDWENVAVATIDKFRSLPPSEVMTISAPSTATHASQNVSSVDNFKKGINCDATAYPTLKDMQL